MTRKKQILLILMEECAEVSQRASKCIRFGGFDNDKELEKEIGDLLCMIDLLAGDDIIDYALCDEQSKVKMEKLKKFSTIFSTVETWEENNERMDIIGQNGNDGLHYES